MKNKKVKQVMADVFNGDWINYNPNNLRYYENGMRMHVFGGWLGEHKTTVELNKTISLTASELKGGSDESKKIKANNQNNEKSSVVRTQ